MYSQNPANVGFDETRMFAACDLAIREAIDLIASAKKPIAVISLMRQITNSVSIIYAII